MESGENEGCLGKLSCDKLLTKSALRLSDQNHRDAEGGGPRFEFGPTENGKIVICLSHLIYDKILAKKCFETIRSESKTIARELSFLVLTK